MAVKQVDLSRILKNRNEYIRPDDTLNRVYPSRERLKAAQLARYSADYRLEKGADMPLRQRFFKILCNIELRVF